ncbi:MAG: hypothetical protein ACJ8F7_19825 [Gemmataceae bacterium]
MPIFRVLLGAPALLLAAGLFARGDEPHLELIRALRAQGEPGLAMEYIQARLTPVPANLAGILPLEIARTRVEVALQENEEGKRLAMFAEARKEFETFLQKDPNNPLAPQARFEIARLVSSLGKEHLNRAKRQEDEAAKKKALDVARPMFQDAAGKLKDAGQLIKEQLAKTPNPTTPDEIATNRELTQAFLQAGLEEGINLFMLAQTYAGEATIKQRGESMEQAIKVLTKVADTDVKHPTCWLARAWLGRCHTFNQDFPKAKDVFETIAKERGAYADAAQRAAGYFQLLMLDQEGQIPVSQLEARANAWMTRYRSFLNTPEGYGVRFFLAQTLWKQGAAGITYDKKHRPTGVTNVAETAIGRAERLMRELAETENDYTERAAKERSSMLLALALRRFPSRDLSKVEKFEDCYMLAQLELAEYFLDLEDLKKQDNFEPEKALALRKERFGRVAKAIDKALAAAKPNDPARDVLNAKYIQVYAHYNVDHHVRAAQLGEALAKTQTKVGRGASAALYALVAYRAMLNDLQAAGDLKEDDAKKLKDNIRRVAKYMEDTWPNDTPTDEARHQLGALLTADGDYIGALAAYSRVTPAYVHLAYVRNEQGVACFNLQRAPSDGKEITPQSKRAWFTRVTNELEKMPDLGAGAEDDVAYRYCLARLQLANLYLQEGKQYAKVEQLAQSLLDSLPKYLTLSEKNTAELRQQAQGMRLVGVGGQVAEMVKAGDLDGAAKLYQPIVKNVEKTGVPGEDAVRVRAALANLLQLALRTSVQKGAMDQAQEILKLLEKVSTGAGSSGPLVQVLRDVQMQINELKRHNPDKLKDTVDKFSSFLEGLAKQPNLSADVRIFLAQGFASLDKPARGVELLSSIPEPPDPGPVPAEPKDSASDEEKKKYEDAKARYDQAAGPWRTYHFVQLTRVRALRQMGRDDNNPKSPHFEAASKLLAQMIGTPQKMVLGL